MSDIGSRLVDRAQGQVRVSLEGLGLDGLIAQLMAAEVHLHEVRRPHAGRVEMTLAQGDLKRVRTIIGTRPIEVSELGRWGVVHRVGRFRPSLAIGLGLAAAVLIWAGGRVWRIEVQGGVHIPHAAVRAALLEMGVYMGQAKNLQVLDDYQARLMIDFPLLTWVGLEQDGTVLRVRLAEAVPPPGTPATTPGDVVALTEGIITAISVQQGTAMVAVGDRVQPGQVLIQGVVTWMDDDMVEGRMEVAARGRVMADVFYQGQARGPVCLLQAVATGECYTTKRVVIGGWSRATTSGQPYERESVETEFFGFGGSFSLFPCGVERTVHRQVDLHWVAGDAQALQEQLTQQAHDQAIQNLPQGARVKQSRVQVDHLPGDEQVMVVTVLVDAELDIAAGAIVRE